METRSRILTSIIGALAFGVVSSVAAPGWAQGSDLGDFDPRPRRVVPQRALEVVPPPVPRECTPGYMAGPGSGVVLGLGAIGVGGTFLWAGVSFADSGTGGPNAMVAGASLMIASGVAAVIYSSIKLKRNAEARRRLC